MNVTIPILCLLLPWLPPQEPPKGDAPPAPTVLRFHPFGALTAPRMESPHRPVGLFAVPLSSEGPPNEEPEVHLQPATGLPLLPADEVIELTKAWTGAEAWEIEGRRLESSGGRLIVVQTPELQDRVRALLGSLERSVARRVTVRVLAFPARHPALVRRVEAGAGPVLDARAVEETLAGLTGVTEFRASGLLGSRLELGAVRESAAVVSWDAEVAEDARQAEPTVRMLREGCSVSAWVRAAGEGRLHVALRWNRATRQAREPVDLGAEGLGKTDLPEFQATRGGAAAAVPPGGGLLVGAAQAEAGEGPTAFLVLPALEADAVSDRQAAFALEDLRAATRPIETFSFAWPGLPPGYGLREPIPPGDLDTNGEPLTFYPRTDREPFLSGDHVVELVKSASPAGAWEGEGAQISLVSEGRFLALKAPAELLSQVRRTLDEILREARRATGIRVMVASGGRPVLSALLSAPERGSSVIVAGREVGLVRTYECMIAQKASIVLPQPTALFEGLALGFRPQRLNGDDRVQLEVRGAWAQLKGPVGQRALGAPKVGTLSAPEVEVVPVAADVTLRAGEPVEVPLGSGPQGAGGVVLTLTAWPIE